MNEKELAIKELGKLGFENAGYLLNWKGYSVYEPLSKDGFGMCIGRGTFCLVAGKKVRMANLDEEISIREKLIEVSEDADPD